MDDVPEAAGPALPPVVVIADSATRRLALADLAERAGLEVVGVYPAAEIEESGIVVLTDGGSGRETVSAPTVIVGSGERPAARRGQPAEAHLPDSATAGQIRAAVAAVSAGLHAFAVARTAEGGVFEELTARESDVLRLMAEGLANRAIALRLGISENTVKFHVASVLAKLGAQSRAEAVMHAVRWGLVPL
jgi:DNA-binding CsgD family transcriptional regulator